MVAGVEPAKSNVTDMKFDFFAPLADPPARKAQYLVGVEGNNLMVAGVEPAKSNVNDMKFDFLTKFNTI